MTWIRRRTRLVEGFTLIEMLVVIGIIILISVIAMPTVGSYFQLSLNSATRDLATTIKETYNSTIVAGKVHRIVYDLKNGSFWVESSSEMVLLDTKESREKEERRRKSTKNNKDQTRSQGRFSLETTITRKKMSLPRGIEYEDIVTQQSQDPITEGNAYTHFFPDGFTEQTIIHLKDQSKHHASLVVTPFLGTTDVFERYVDGAEAFGK